MRVEITNIKDKILLEEIYIAIKKFVYALRECVTRTYSIFYEQKHVFKKIKRRRSLNLVINLLGLRNVHSISYNTTTFISFVN